MIKDYRLEFRIQMRDSCFLEIMNFEVRLSLPNKHTVYKKDSMKRLFPEGVPNISRPGPLSFHFTGRAAGYWGPSNGAPESSTNPQSFSIITQGMPKLNSQGMAQSCWGPSLLYPMDQVPSRFGTGPETVRPFTIPNPIHLYPSKPSINRIPLYPFNMSNKYSEILWILISKTIT